MEVVLSAPGVVAGIVGSPSFARGIPLHMNGQNREQEREGTDERVEGGDSRTERQGEAGEIKEEFCLNR